MAPYQVEQQMDDDDDFEDNENGIRVLGIAYIAERYVTGCYIFESLHFKRQSLTLHIV